MADTLFDFDEEPIKKSGPVTCLGITFENDDKRRDFFREELRKKLPELRLIEGFPIGEDDDIINLSDPPYYTACPNPWVNDFIKEWESEKTKLQVEGKRTEDFVVKEPYAVDVSEGKNNPIYMAHAYHTKVPHTAIMRYILHYTQPGDIIFDGFSGTGMTGVAANMCASPYDVRSLNTLNPAVGIRHGICSDLAPAATLISASYNVNYNVNSFRQKAEAILNKVESELGWMYETEINNRKAKVNYYIWSDVFSCHECGEEIVFWKEAVNLESDTIKETFHCPRCGSICSKKNLNKVWETYYDPVVKKTLTRNKKAIVRVNYTTERRGEINPTIKDFDILSRCESTTIANPITYKLPSGEKTKSIYNSNHVEYLHQWFTYRNYVILSRIRELLNGDIEMYAWFTSVIQNSSTMYKFRLDRKGGILNGTFFIPSLTMEQNPIKLLRGKIKDFCSAYYPTRGNSIVNVCSATSLANMASNSIDYIFVDPPFGSNIMYSELNSIWEGWLKVMTNSKDEAIISKDHNKGLLDYQTLMNASFKEFYRVLKPGKWATIEFSNTSAAVWNSIQNALQGVGFILTNVAAIDKQQGSFNAVTSTTAVKQDLVITCFKPTDELSNKFAQSADKVTNVWDFIELLLNHLTVHIRKDNATTAIVERSPKILYDRLVAYYIKHGYQVPIDATDFQKGLKERYVERDGMFFTAEQAIEYEEKKKETTSFMSLSLLVGSEAEGIEWLKRKLENNPQTYSEILPGWMQDLVKPKKGDTLPELMQILDENFLKDDNGYWHIPDLNDQAQLEAVKTKRLLKEFEVYVEAKKVKHARLEALRAGFRECYINKDFATIIAVGNKIEEELLTTDEILMRYYDIASTRI